ncbi:MULTISPECIES: TraQ conjugal transfer family protein [unclassified Croceitalea]|uniref:TraQ conjugal transfer family protein n=1 Tax=unclassified Croceitalea TaxID=2632280 RepID=UPI0030D79C2A
MKKKYYWLMAFLVLLACSKDFEDALIDSFDFNFTVITSDSGFIFEGSEADFRVVPERTITTTRFNFSYSIDEGEGFFQMENGEVLPEQTELELPELLWKLNYIPTTTGTHVLKLKAKDQKGNEKEETITYEIDFAPFTVLFNQGANTFIVNQTNDLNLTVVSESNTELYETLSVNDIDASYTLSFTVEGGTGVFVINGEDYEPGQKATIEEGTLEFEYIPSTLGEHIITLIAIAPDGAVREQQIIVPVENVQFFLLASIPSDKVSIGEDIDVSLSLQSSDDSEEIDYRLSFFYAPDSEGIGTLVNENGEAQTAGQSRPLEPGNYSYKFNSNVLGIKKLYFDVSDSNNQVKRDSILVEVTSIPFSFSGQAVGTSTGINQPIELSLSLSTNATEDSNVEYNISFAQEGGNGELKDLDDIIIPPNTAYDVTPGVFKLSYTPFTLGEHRLLFQATDTYGQSVSSEVSLMATNAQLNFTAAATNSEMIVGGTNTISVNLGEQGNASNLTYEMSYFVTGGTGTLTEGGNTISSSTFITTTPGSRTFSFLPDLPGNYTLTFTLRDSNGQTLQAPTSFVVTNTNFQFSATEANGEIGLGQNNNININIVPGTTNNGTSYTMTYDSSSNGTLSIGGVSYSPGQTITVQEGSFVAIYNPTRTGNYQLDFTVVDSNGVVRTDSSTFNVINSDFVLSAAATPSEIFASQTSSINIDINQVVSNPSASYELSYSVTGGTGTFSGPGGNVQAGIFTPISAGSTSWTYNPSAEGAHAIIVQVRDNSGVTKEKVVVVNVVSTDFTFTATEAQADANIGESVGINLNIQESVSGIDTYTAVYTTNNNGTLRYNGNTIQPGVSFTIVAGNSSASYTGTTSGRHDVDFSVTSSSGTNKSDGAEINYIGNTFGFTATSQIPNLTVGQTSGISFNLTETISGVDTYTASYTNDNNGTFIFNGVAISPGQTFTITPGTSSATYSSLETGSQSLDFTVTSSSGDSETDSADFNFTSNIFTFTASPQVNTADYNTTVPINFNIAESVSGVDTYTALYTLTQGLGTFQFNGTTIQPGNTFTISSGASSGSFTGIDGGSKTLDFQVTSSSSQVVSDDARIVFRENPEIVEVFWQPSDVVDNITNFRNTITYNGNIFRTAAEYDPLEIRAEVVSSTVGADNRAIVVKELKLNGGATGQDIINIWEPIPNNSEFTLYIDLQYDDRTYDYTGAELLVRFTVRNSSTSITKDILYRD